jgi:hypothetical protein
MESVPPDVPGHVVGDGRRVDSTPDHRWRRNPGEGRMGFDAGHDSVVTNRR